MKKLQLKKVFTIVYAFLLAQISNVAAQSYSLTLPPNGGHQKSTITQWLGLTSVSITYNGPNVYDRKGNSRKGHIWGELIPYGFNDPGGFGTALSSPWRCGANEITQIFFSHNVLVNGKEIKAGTYGLMLAIDSVKPWTWIFSSNAVSWGTYYYSKEDDVLRVEAIPEENQQTEWLSFIFDNRQPSSTNAWLLWDNKKVGFRIEVPDAIQLYVSKLKAELTSYAGFDYRNWIRAAQFCLDNKTNFSDALKWIDISMDSIRFNGQSSFRQLALKTSLLKEMGELEKAKAVIQVAVNITNIS
ncbi:MAG: DUF2911 domain-containing protein, partial [Gloeobacteraceae cyanobacterium ES-bin-316]|nr:DUF2911 domain-containing protein [Ferruginibacter sp.]